MVSSQSVVIQFERYIEGRSAFLDPVTNRSWSTFIAILTGRYSELHELQSFQLRIKLYYTMVLYTLSIHDIATDPFFFHKWLVLLSSSTTTVYTKILNLS